MTLVSVIIPAYNESLRLPPTLDNLLTYIRNKAKLKYARNISEIIIVDDASKDGTLEWVERYREKFEDEGVRLVGIQHMNNSGKWAAIRTGINVALNDRVLLMDADGSAGITNLEKVYSLDDTVFGSRFLPDSYVWGKSFYRTLISQGYRFYALSWYGYASHRRDVSDLQCPFKLFRKSDMKFPITNDRFAGDIQLALSMKKGIRNIPVDFIHVRGSKVRFQDVFEMAKQTAQIAYRHRRVYFRQQK